MNLRWPKRFTLRFRCQGNKVSDLLVSVVVISEVKNNYSLAPALTDGGGEIVLTMKDILESIRTAQQEYPMDYSGNLANCSGIEVIVEDSNDLKQRVERISEYYPKESEKLSKMVKSASNSSYTSKRVKLQGPIVDRIYDIELVKAGTITQQVS